MTGIEDLLMTSVNKISSLNSSVFKNTEINAVTTTNSIFNTDFNKTKDNPKYEVKGYSKEYINRLVKHEGGRKKEYKINGVRTIGFGHNIDADKNYKFGSEITEDQALMLLEKDLNACTNYINSKAKQEKITLTDNQKEAITDLAFNGGIGKAKDLLEAKSDDEILKVFQNNCYMGGKLNPNIANRRIYNIYKYFKNNPTEKVASKMQTILITAKKQYDASYPNKTAKEKAAYFQESQLFLNEIRKNIKNKPTLKKGYIPKEQPRFIAPEMMFT